MNVKELRATLAAFDDDMELFAAPDIRMDLAGRGVEIDVPHPLEQYKLRKLHIVGDVDRRSGEVAKRRLVLSFEQPAHPVETITPALRRKFIEFREFYLSAYKELAEADEELCLLESGAWEAASLAVPMTENELSLYNKFHVAVHNLKVGNEMLKGRTA